jgi:hypothetical protein
MTHHANGFLVSRPGERVLAGVRCPRHGTIGSMSEQATCIQLRVRRIVCEDAYVAVPVTQAVMKKEPEPDGTFRIDFDAFVAEGIRLSESPEVDWQMEEGSTVAHPTQRPTPEGRRVFDGHR